MIRMNIWLLLRVAFLGCALVPATVAADVSSHTAWTMAVCFPVVFGVLVFVWMQSLTLRENVIWTDPYSFTTPFFPSDRYPLQSLSLVAILSIVSGINSIIWRLVIVHTGIQAHSVMFLLIGVATALVVKAAPKGD